MPKTPDDQKLKPKSDADSQISDEPEENPEGLSQATEDFDESPDKTRVEHGEPLS